jgi:uncharacterized protein YbjT (DUF2867 family)
MILITGAGGKTGQAIIQALIKKGRRVRAFAYSSRHEAQLRKLGADEVILGDMLDPEAFKEAAKGIRAIYHICPNVHPNEVEIGINAIEAAKATGAERFLYHSVLHPQIEAMPHHWLKMRVEELIFTSGLPFTILQPTAYMQNILGQWDKIQESGVYSVPYSLDTRVSLVDLNDVSEAAAIVLTQPGHIGATYELCGPDFPSQIEIADMLSEASVRQVTAKHVSIEAWQKNAQNAGLGKYQIETLTKMFAYYEGQNFQGNAKVLEMLLGRESTGFKSLLSKLA